LSTAFLFTGSVSQIPIRFKREYHKKDLIVAVDGGANILYKESILPDLIIGDMDSIQSEVLDFYQDKAEIVTYPKEKDATDTELALQYCLQKKIAKIVIYTTTCGRFDQLFGLISLLFLARDFSIPVFLENDDFEVFLANKKQTLSGKVGQIISLIPLSEKIENISSEGLKYNLHQEQLLRNTTRGISNVFSENKAFISFDRGDLLIVMMPETEQ